MRTVKAMLFHPIAPRITAAEVAACVLSGAGVLTLLLGIVIMPSLQLTESGFYLALLALVGFLFVAHAAGQLTVIADELRRTRKQGSI